jgi:hypothetical protein
MVVIFVNGLVSLNKKEKKMIVSAITYLIQRKYQSFHVNYLLRHVLQCADQDRVYKSGLHLKF